MWRGSSRFGLSVAASFVWRCLNNFALTPFPHPPHRTGRADFPHPALGQDLTLSPTTRCVLARSIVRVQALPLLSKASVTCNVIAFAAAVRIPATRDHLFR